MRPEQLENIPDLKKYYPEKKEWGYVYFVISKEKIVYVGKTTTDISTRLIEFRKYKKQEYDAVYYIVRHPKDLQETERHYINQFKPICNIQGKKSNSTELNKP